MENEIEKWKEEQDENNKLSDMELSDKEKIAMDAMNKLSKTYADEEAQKEIVGFPFENVIPKKHNISIEINEQESYCLKLPSVINPTQFVGLMERLNKVLRLVEADVFANQNAIDIKPMPNPSLSSIAVKGSRYNTKLNKYTREEILRFLKWYYATPREERLSRMSIEFPNLPRSWITKEKAWYLKKKYNINQEEAGGSSFIRSISPSINQNRQNRRYTKEQIVRLLNIYYNEPIEKRWEVALREFPNLSKTFFTTAGDKIKRYNIQPHEVGLIRFPKKYEINITDLRIPNQDKGGN